MRLPAAVPAVPALSPGGRARTPPTGGAAYPVPVPGPTSPVTEPASGRLVVLGCDGSWPGPGGACSGYLVTSGTTALWLDAGTGTFAALQLAVDPASVDGLVLSHGHRDHWSDLADYVTWARHSGRGPSRPLPVYGPATLAGSSGLEGAPELDWHPVADGDQVRIGRLELTFSRTDHGPETLAVRVQDGSRSLGYSADTGPAWHPRSLGPPLDLFVCEATFTSDVEGTAGHLSGRQAGALASEAGVGTLAVTHRWPTVDAGMLADEAAVAFGRAVVQLAPGAVLAW